MNLEQEQMDFLFWATEVWPDGNYPDAAWLAWQARASKPGATVTAEPSIPKHLQQIPWDPSDDDY